MIELQATPKTIAIDKSPRQTLIQGLDFSPWLMEQGSTLKQWSAQVAPAKSGGLKVASITQLGDSLELAFTGGVLGDVYAVVVNVLAQNNASTKVEITVRLRGTSEDQVAGSGGVVLVRPLITVPSVSVAESAGYAVSAVVLSIQAIDDIELLASASPVTASGADFTLPVQWSLNGADWSDGPNVTIPAGAASFYLRVAIIDDALTEGDETLTLAVEVLTGSTQNSQASGTVTIVANDVLPSLSIGTVTVDEGQPAAFTVTLSEPSAQTVTVAYATRAGSASSADFTPSSGTLLFAPGITQQTVTVPTRADAFPEAPETFFVDLSAAVNATISAASGAATIRLNQPAANATLMTLLLGDLAGGSFYLGL